MQKNSYDKYLVKISYENFAEKYEFN